MKELDTTFRSCGFNFQQIEREGNYAIYAKRQDKIDRDTCEVVCIGSHNGYKLGENYILPAETYPCNSMWGTKGWSCTTLASAKVRYNDLRSGGINNKSITLFIKSKPVNKNTKQPLLTCIVTGIARPTTAKYLESKANKYDTTGEDIAKHYVSKPALKLLKAGCKVDAIRQQLGINNNETITDEVLKRVFELNGRQRVREETK